MLENLSNIIIVLTSAIGAIGAAFLAGLAIWTFRDIRSRTRDILTQILATVMVAVIPIAGILVYLMLRPRETLNESYVRALEEEALLSSIEHQEFCPGCGRRVEGDMRFCPSCHTKLRNNCRSCNRAVHLSWDMCPYCGAGLQPEMPQVRKPATKSVAAPPPKAVNAAPKVAIPEAVAPAEIIEPAIANDDAKPSATGAVGGLLDRIGGAVEGAMNRAKPKDDAK